MAERKATSKIARCVRVTVVSLIVLLALEGLCRLTESGSKYRPVDLLGYELVPDYEGRRESVNAYGIRGREVGEKKPGAFRILAMGGSTTWGHKVADDETWPCFLEEKLHDLGFGHVEVLNGAVSGYGLEQIVRALEHRHLRALEPDLVVVYSGWNYAVLEGNGNVKNFLTKAKSSEEKDLIHHLALVRWMDRKLHKLLPDVKTKTIPREEILAEEARARRVMAEAFPRLFEKLGALCADRGVRVAAVRYPALVQLRFPLDGSLTERYEEDLRRPGKEGLSIEALLENAREIYGTAMAVLEKAADKSRIPLLDVAGRLESAAGKKTPPGRKELWLGYFRDRMHLNPQGNEALAEVLADLLVENELVVNHVAEGG